MVTLSSTFIPVVSSRYPSDWRFWVFIVIFAALYFAFSSRSAKDRRTELSEVAPCIGLLWLDTLPAIPLGIAFLQPGMDGGFSNVMSGSRAGCQIATGLTDNLAGAIAYLTFLPAIFFLLLEPYNKNRFVRFHSFQCIFLSVAWFTLSFALTVVSLIGWALLLVLPIAGLILWIFVIVQAYRGQSFKVHVIGDLAEKYASNA